jgi:hypothetical protein
MRRRGGRRDLVAGEEHRLEPAVEGLGCHLLDGVAITLADEGLAAGAVGKLCQRGVAS